MDTLHTVLNRGCSIWDQTRMPEEELRRRLNQVRAAMKYVPDELVQRITASGTPA